MGEPQQVQQPSTLPFSPRIEDGKRANERSRLARIGRAPEGTSGSLALLASARGQAAGKIHQSDRKFRLPH